MKQYFKSWFWIKQEKGNCANARPYLPKVFAGHLGHDLVEEKFVLAVDESIVEHTLGLVTEQTENLFGLADYSWVSL